MANVVTSPARLPARPLAAARKKFLVAVLVALAWTLFSVWVSDKWRDELGAAIHPLFAILAITFIAYVPGFMNAFLVASLLLDRRQRSPQRASYPGVTVLIAAYQEAGAIADTIESIALGDYPGEVEVLVLSDGSTDGTVECAEQAIGRLSLRAGYTMRVLAFTANRGKAVVLNEGLAKARHELIVTVDGDSRLRSNALRAIVGRLLSAPENTMAVAGSVLARNGRENLITGAQEWDYFHGIAAVKRMQSMYHGALVAQGAFSIYRRRALVAVGGWPDCVGEDIVLTWAMLKRGYLVGYAEDALVFTNVPTTYRQFSLQRKRWSRGLIEALDHHEGLLFKRRLSTLFIWWNLLFLPLDLIYTVIFIPGVLAAVFLHNFSIAGPMTLAVLPLAALWNALIYRIQTRTLRREGVELKHNWAGLGVYLLAYTVLMQPVCVWGYASEVFGLAKKWGTKR
ncbi:MAG TPA: glycosyltransferase [Caulobacteraceae bacterium]